MTIQHSSYRRIPPPSAQPDPVLFDPEPHTNHSRLFHATLRKLRSALYANDPRSIARFERELDQIVAAWEREANR